MKLKQATEATHVNVLLYGPAGTGKSTAAASAPGGVLFLNFDLSNALHFARSRDKDGKIMEVDLSDGIMNTLVEVARIVNDPKQTEIVQTVVIDTVGELHRRLLEEMSNRAIRPTRNQYGDTTTHIERFARMLCEASVNAVFLAHDVGIKDEASGEIERLPSTGTTNPALGAKLQAMVDVVAFTGVVQQEGKNIFMGQLISAKGRRGKDRFDVLGDSRRLDLGEWIDMIHATNNNPTVKAAVTAIKEAAA